MPPTPEPTPSLPPAARWAAAILLAALGTLGLLRGLLTPPPAAIDPGPGTAFTAQLPPDPRSDTRPTPAPVSAEAPAQGQPAPGATPRPPALSPTRLININTATAAELDLLPGIGPVTAERIIEYRQTHGPFRSLDDLDNITRIGPKTIADLAPYATAE